MVGPTGFEPVTSRPPDGRATRLRYGPKYYLYLALLKDKNTTFYLKFPKDC